MAPESRVAVYFAPPADSALAIAGAHWLGRSAEAHTPCPQPDFLGMAEVTAEARLYGFHATLKPPFRLASGKTWADLVRAAELLAARISPFNLPPLAVADLHGFLALRETAPCTPLQALADDCVQTLDAFRAPPTSEDEEKRRRSPLTPEQEKMLARWGYPYVFSEWFFHMTLTRRLQPAEKAFWWSSARTFFADTLLVPLRATDICLFRQPGAGQVFISVARLPLRG